MKKLIIEVEKTIWPLSDLDRLFNVLSYAVGTYNARQIDIVGISHSESLTGLEWVREMINRNNFDSFGFDFGFGSSHFWLNNLNGDRTVFIYECEV